MLTSNFAPQKLNLTVWCGVCSDFQPVEKIVGFLKRQFRATVIMNPKVTETDLCNGVYNLHITTSLANTADWFIKDHATVIMSM